MRIEISGAVLNPYQFKTVTQALEYINVEANVGIDVELNIGVVYNKPVPSINELDEDFVGDICIADKPENCCD